jgi:hypothetical protein
MGITPIERLYPKFFGQDGFECAMDVQDICSNWILGLASREGSLFQQPGRAEKLLGTGAILALLCCRGATPDQTIAWLNQWLATLLALNTGSPVNPALIDPLVGPAVELVGGQIRGALASSDDPWETDLAILHERLKPSLERAPRLQRKENPPVPFSDWLGRRVLHAVTFPLFGKLQEEVLLLKMLTNLAQQEPFTT